MRRKNQPITRPEIGYCDCFFFFFFHFCFDSDNLVFIRSYNAQKISREVNSNSLRIFSLFSVASLSSRLGPVGNIQLMQPQKFINIGRKNT